MSENRKICPVEKAGMLDNLFRRMLQNPDKLIRPYVKENMTVLDFGCGSGFFTMEIAGRVGEGGMVVASDVQEGMLEILKNKIQNTNVQNRVRLHHSSPERVGLEDPIQFDFILIFYAMHELPDPDSILTEMKTLLKPTGKLWIVEPIFHVSQKDFLKLEEKINDIGYRVSERPGVFFSHSMLLTHQ